MSYRENIAHVLYRSGLLASWRRAATSLDQLNKKLSLAPQLDRGCLILVFHRLQPTPSPFHPGTSLALFEWLCAHLAESYQVLPLGVMESRRLSRTPPSSAVAITFDDGYADNYHLALPILRRHGLPATLFVTTGCVGGASVLWTSRLGWILEHGSTPREPQLIAGRPNPLRTAEERARAIDPLKHELKALDRALREERLAQLGEAMGVTGFAELQHEMLTWDQIKELDAGGFVAGAHTVSHPILSREPLEKLRRELRDSREELEGRLGRRVDLLAYPNGSPADYNLQVMEEARRAEFRLACTMVFGANTPLISPFELRRCSIYGATHPRVALQLERYFYLA